MKRFILRIASLIGAVACLATLGLAAEETGPKGPFKSIQEFGVLPYQLGHIAKHNLQKAIDWASPMGAALYVEPMGEASSVYAGVLLSMAGVGIWIS